MIPPIGSPYATLAELKRVIQREDTSADEDLLLTGALEDATRALDKETGQWFNSRVVSFKTEANDFRVRRLFWPARAISITSIVEDGETLIEGDDKDFLVYPFWAEREDGRFWDTERQRIVVTGNFGHATVPEDIRRATLELAAHWSGLNQRTFVAGDGVAGAVLNNEMPASVKRVIAMNTYQRFAHQPFVYFTP